MNYDPDNARIEASMAKAKDKLEWILLTLRDDVKSIDTRSSNLGSYPGTEAEWKLLNDVSYLLAKAADELEKRLEAEARKKPDFGKLFLESE